MKILEEMFMGNLCPADMWTDSGAKSQLLFAEFENLYLELKSSIPKEQQKSLSEIFNVGIDLAVEVQKEAFSLGFAIGERISEECRELLA